jgi:hypothetical protein
LFGDPGKFTGDALHRPLGLVALLLAAQFQLGGDRAGSPASTTVVSARTCPFAAA